MKRSLLFSAIMFMGLVYGLNVHSQDYTELTNCLSSWGKVMDKYAEKMTGITDLEKLSAQCIELTDSVNVYTPCLKTMKDKFPDIDPENLPEEVMEHMKYFEEATNRFSEMLSGLMQTANKYPDNEPFQAAFGKLNLAIYNSRR